MKESTTVKKNAVALYLKETLLSALGFIIAFLLAGLVIVLAGMALYALVNAVNVFIPEEHQMMFWMAAVIVFFAGVFCISMMIDDFKKKKAQEEYNERLKWQKERLQMSFEERLRGSRQ